MTLKLKDVLAISFFYFPLLTSNSQARTCMPLDVSEDFEEAVLANELVFIGNAHYTIKTLTQLKGREEHLLEAFTRFEEVNWLKGNVEKSTTAKVKSYASHCDGCIYDFEVGVTYLVFGTTSEGRVHTRDCQFIRPIEFEQALIKRVSKVLEQKPDSSENEE